MPQKPLPEVLNTVEFNNCQHLSLNWKKNPSELIIRLAGSEQKKWHLVLQHSSSQEYWGIFLGNSDTRNKWNTTYMVLSLIMLVPALNVNELIQPSTQQVS